MNVDYVVRSEDGTEYPPEIFHLGEIECSVVKTKFGCIHRTTIAKSASKLLTSAVKINQNKVLQIWTSFLSLPGNFLSDHGSSLATA